MSYSYSSGLSNGYGDGYSPWAYDGPGVSNYSYGVYPGQDFGGNYSPPYQIQSPSFSPAFTNPNFTPAQIGGGSPSITPGMYATPALAYPVEEVTVSATPQPTTVQSPSFSPGFLSPSYTPGMITPPFTGGYNFSPATSPPVEAVTVEATRPPAPQAVQSPTFSPSFFSPAFTPGQIGGGSPAITPNMVVPPVRKNQARATPGGGGSAGGGSKSPQQPPQQRPQVPQQRPLLPQQRPVTPQQQQKLVALTPQQLQNLLNNPNLTPQQRAVAQAVQQARQRAAAAGASPAQQDQAARAAAAASPLQPYSFVLPLLIAAGVAAAWGISHPRTVQAQVATVRRRVRRILN